MWRRLGSKMTLQTIRKTSVQIVQGLEGKYSLYAGAYLVAKLKRQVLMNK